MADRKKLLVGSLRHLAVVKLVTRFLAEYCAEQNGEAAKLDKFLHKINN
jgi:hypothetical protein